MPPPCSRREFVQLVAGLGLCGCAGLVGCDRADGKTGATKKTTSPAKETAKKKPSLKIPDPGLAVSACGLDCSKCPVYRAKNDPQLAMDLAMKFSRVSGRQVEPAHVRCDGCRGKADARWSPGCKIMKCSVVKKKHYHCGQCGYFPCKKLKLHAAKGGKYQAGVDRLKKLREEALKAAGKKPAS